MPAMRMLAMGALGSARSSLCVVLGAVALLAAGCGDDVAVGDGGAADPADVGAIDVPADVLAGDPDAGPVGGGSKDAGGAGAADVGPPDAGGPGLPDAAAGDGDPDAAWTDEDADEPPEDSGAPPDDDPCEADECWIEEECWANLEIPSDEPCRTCLVLQTRLEWTAFDGGACDDGDACTSDDACFDGLCVGTPADCSDGNPCTSDGCDAVTGQCSHESNEAPCSDGDPCTAPDTCSGGACVTGPPNDCDDGNPCTMDTCLTGVGCLHQDADGATCDDGDACTHGDTCAAGACQGGAALPCDDADLCTLDHCDSAVGCKHQSIAYLCTDDNPCTEQSCDADKGCIFPFNAEPCDDGSACTTGDHCAEGACLGAAVPYDDGNPCTDDACDPALGPVHVANTVPCDDGDACTLGDQCGGGACVAGSGQPDCEDANTCTDDSCAPATGCVHTPNTAPCDDGTVCTSDDQCGGGVCGGTPVDCDDGNACTSDSCDPAAGCKSQLVVSGACRPEITVTWPPRAATIAGSTPATVEVQGTVSSGAGPITSLFVNGIPTAVGAGGAFTRIVQATVGGNTLVLEATDAMGSARRRVQAFHWAKGYNKPVPPKGGMAAPGVGIFLSQEVIDDGDHSLPADDLATIFELVLDGFDLGALVPSNQPVASQLGYDIYVKNIKDSNRTVALQSGFGVLKMTAEMTGITGDVEAKHDWLFDLDGDLTISKITIKADVSVSVVNHELDAQLKNVDVTITGANISIGWLVDWLIGIFVDSFIEDIEASFESEMTAQIEPMLADALSSLAFSTSFDMPSLDPSGGAVAIDLVTDFQDVGFAPGGGTFELRAGAYAGQKGTPYSNDGAVKRLGCGTGFQQLVLPKADPLELAFSDDTFNLLLWSAWDGGLLEFDVPPSMLADVELGDFGISDVAIHLSGMLAPVMSDCQPGQELLVHIGDLRADAEMKVFGKTMNVVMYASFAAGVELQVADGALGLALTEIKQLESEITVQQDGLIGSEGVIGSMIDDNLVPALLGALGEGTLGGFPLPEIDLSASLEGLPPGTGIAIDPKKVTRQGGNTVISGDLK